MRDVNNFMMDSDLLIFKDFFILFWILCKFKLTLGVVI